MNPNAGREGKQRWKEKAEAKEITAQAKKDKVDKTKSQKPSAAPNASNAPKQQQQPKKAEQKKADPKQPPRSMLKQPPAQQET